MWWGILKLVFLFCLTVTSPLIAWPVTASSHDEDRCLQCHGNTPAVSPKSEAAAPLLQEQFSMEWSMVEFVSQQNPPFSVPPQPNDVLRGVTYYDWKRQSMTEIYRDKCIDIFSSGRDFACQFISNKDQTFLVRFANQDLNQPTSCCLWSKEGFWAPRPDVIANMGFEKEMPLAEKPTNWFLLDIPLPGPFGYGFYKEGNLPAAFWFPVISGWVQQNFSNYKTGVPNPTSFSVPSICSSAAPVCEQ